MDTAKKSQSLGIATLVLYLLSLAPAIWSTAATSELVLLMGRGSGMYSDYGKTTGEVALATIFLIINITWLLFDTFIAIKVFKRHLALRWLGAAIVFSIVVFVTTAIYLLGVGHF